jgi:hypothetical protein
LARADEGAVDQAVDHFGRDADGLGHLGVAGVAFAGQFANWVQRGLGNVDRLGAILAQVVLIEKLGWFLGGHVDQKVNLIVDAMPH